MVGSSTVADDLGILAKTNAQILTKVEDKIAGKTEDILAGYMNDLKSAQTEAEKIRDPKKRAEALNLVRSRMQDVRKRMDTDKTDFSDVVLGFAAFAKQVDDQIEDIFKETPAQTARKAAAAKRVTDARAEVAIAPSRSTLFGMRDPVSAAKEELEKAEAELVEVNAQVAREINEKAREAKIEESLARLLAFGERSYTALVEGHRIMVARTAAIKADKERSFDIAKKTQTMIEDLDQKITQLEAERDTARDLVDHASENDPNYAELKQRLSDAEAALQTAASDRMALLNVSREETINAQEYSGYERTAISMTGDCKALAALQQAKNRNIAQKRTHYIETMAQLKKIELTATSIKAGNEVDRRLLDTMLEAGAASTNVRQEITQDQPERLKYAQERLEEQDQAQLRAAGIDQKIREDFAARYLQGGGTPTPAV